MNNKNKDYIDLREFLKNIFNYKLFIFFITLLFFIAANMYIYIKPSIYSTYAILEVKSHGNKNQNNKDLVDNTFYGTYKEMDKENEILKTFNINKKIIKKLDLGIQFYIKEKYKKSELYGNDIPLNVMNIKILDNKIVGREIRFFEKDQNHYTLEIVHTLVEKILYKFFDQKPILLENKAYKYGVPIKTKYFELLIRKNQELKRSIYFKLNGDSYAIYKNIIKNNLSISQLKENAPLIKIEYEDNIPTRATEYINKLIEVFLADSIEDKVKQNNTILEFITNQLSKIKLKLNQSENQLKNYKISNRVVQSSSQIDRILEDSSRVELELSKNKLENEFVDKMLLNINRGDNLNVIAPYLSDFNDESSLKLLHTLQKLEIEKSTLQSEYTNEYPALVLIAEKINLIQEKIISNVKNLKTSLNYKETNLNKLKSTYSKSLLKLPKNEMELVNLKREYEVNSRMYNYLLEKKSQNEIVKVATVSDYKVIEKAHDAIVPIKPKKLLIVIVITMLGLVFAIILALAHNFSKDRIKNTLDIERNTLLPLYGNIPFQKQKKNKVTVQDTFRSPFTDAFRTLRVNLQFLDKVKKDGVIFLVTSTMPDEGKSTISANLATSFSLVKSKTVVVNFDLRKPNLHQFFSIENEIGLSTYLDNQCSLDDIIVSTEFTLDFIPSGPIPLNPTELLLEKQLTDFFNTLRKRYDYIIVDTAPLGLVIDTKILMSYSDFNLVIIRANYAKKGFLATIESIALKQQFNNIGLILNASKVQDGEHGYGYSYEYS